MNIKSETTKSELVKTVVQNYFSDNIFEILEGCADKLQKELNEHLNFETVVKFDELSGTSNFNIYFGDESDKKVIHFSVKANVKGSNVYSVKK